MKTKTCSKCKRIYKDIKPNFHKTKLIRGGYQRECKSCVAKYGTIYKQSPAGIYSKSKEGAKRRGISIISKPLFIKWHNSQIKKCHYCGIYEHDIYLLDGNFGNGIKRLTIDRIDSSIGYELGNMVLACFRCNSIKSDFFTEKEMVEIAQIYITPKRRINGN